MWTTNLGPIYEEGMSLVPRNFLGRYRYCNKVHLKDDQCLHRTVDKATGHTEEGVNVTSSWRLPASFLFAPFGETQGSGQVWLMWNTWPGLANQSSPSLWAQWLARERPCSLSRTNQSEDQAFGWESDHKDSPLFVGFEGRSPRCCWKLFCTHEVSQPSDRVDCRRWIKRQK